MTVLWVTTAVFTLACIPFVLIWWRIGDRWADSENKRFIVKEGEDLSLMPKCDTTDAETITLDESARD